VRDLLQRHPRLRSFLLVLWYLAILLAIFAALEFPQREFRYWRM
jgi:hypothetical protein